MALDATIVIPQFNQARLTCECIASLRHAERQVWPVVVVDDGSESAERGLLQSAKLEGVEVLARARGGVTAAWNAGAAAANTPFVVFLNNDVLFGGPSIDRLVEPLRSGEAAVVGAAVREERLLPDELLRRLPVRRFVEGWCLAVAMDEFRSLGGFDEAMRLYWSDTDFQLRAVVRRLGREQTLVSVRVPLRHLGHRTAHGIGERRRQWQADRDVFIAKWSRLTCSTSCRSATSGRSSEERRLVPGR